MLSVESVKLNIYPIFKMAEKDGLEFFVKRGANKNSKPMVFKMSISLTNVPYPKLQWTNKRKKYHRKQKVDMKIEECPLCQSPMVLGICTSRECKNKKIPTKKALK